MNVQRFVISAAGYRDLKVLRPAPTRDSPWGPLAVLQGTVWGELIPVVSGEVWSHALHGYMRPLLQVIGRPPDISLRKVPEPYRFCVQHSQRCLMADANCHPCGKLPACYEPPGLGTDEARRAAATVALAWAEGRYVVVVVGEEFSI